MLLLWVEQCYRKRNQEGYKHTVSSVPSCKISLFLLAKSLLSAVFSHLQLYPDYIYSIVRLLRPEHVIEQWQEQQLEAAEGASTQQQFSIPAEPPAMQLQNGASSPQPPAGSAAAVHAESANGGSTGLVSHASGTVKQPPGQVAQARFALTSAFLEKVGKWFMLLLCILAAISQLGSTDRGSIKLLSSMRPHAT